MVEQAKSWIKENTSLVVFLIAQAVALGAAAAAVIAYSVKLETRVHIMETRGAEYTVARMSEMQQRLTVLEQHIKSNEAKIERITEQILKEMQQQRTR